MKEKNNNTFVKWMNNSVNQKKQSFKRVIDNPGEVFKKSGYSLGSIGLGLLVGMIVIAIMGNNPMILISEIFTSSFSNIRTFGNLLSSLSWLIPIGLSLAVGFRAGIFNIGAAGQMMAAGMTGYLFAYHAPQDLSGGWIVTVIFGISAGMAVAWIIGILKIKFGVNEVLTSIMFNWILFWAYKLMQSQEWSPYYDVNTGGTLSLVALGLTNNTLKADWLSNLFTFNGTTSHINIGLFLSIIALLMVWFVFKKTGYGFKLTVAGANPGASKYSGENQDSMLMKSFMISGALAGLAGIIFYLGISMSLPIVHGDLPTEGFNGITIALIGFNNPMGVLGGSVFMGMVLNTQIGLSKFMDANIINIIVGIIILFTSATQYFIVYEPMKKRAEKKARQRKVGGN